MSTLRIGGLFTGIGAHHSAVDRLGIPYEVAFQCDFNPDAVLAYDLMHGVVPDLGDIRSVRTLDDHPVDVLVFTPPCQDVSQANRHAVGCADGSGSRSSLMHEVPRILEATSPENRPRYLVMEEVPTMASKYADVLEELLDRLAGVGYRSVFGVMNAKDHGTPQNRRRLIVVSKLGGEPPAIPAPVPLQARMGDYLEDEVDPSYLMSEERTRGMVRSSEMERARGHGFRVSLPDPDGVAHCITGRPGYRKTDNYVRCVRVGTLDMNGYDCIKRVYSPMGLCPTIPTQSGGCHVPKVEVGDVIRKLTERECFRLMGYTDVEFNRVAPHFRRTVLYNLAGNSVCVSVFERVLRSIAEDMGVLA